MEIAQQLVSLHPFRRRPFASISDSLGHDNDRVKRQRFAPECEPWNREAFVRRAKSFSLLHWGTKPVELCPLECARYGWLCIGRDLMSCECCTAVICVNLSNRNGNEYNYLTRHYKSQLTHGHEQGCNWRGNPCSQTFVNLAEDPVGIRSEFLDRYKTWVGRIECLETEVFTYPALHRPVRQLLKKRWSEHEDASNMNPSDLVLLSACGWQLKEVDSQDYLSSNWLVACNYCNRQVNLKFYDLDATSNPSAANTSSPEPLTDSELRTQELDEQTDNFPQLGHLFPTEELREPFAGPDSNEIVEEGMFGWGLLTPPSKTKTIRSKRSRSMVDVEDSRAGKRLKWWCDPYPSDIPARWPGSCRKRRRESPPPSILALDDEPGSKKLKQELEVKSDPGAEVSRRAQKRKFPQHSHESDKTRSKRHCSSMSLNTFNVLKEHAYFCPYVVEKSDGPGWVRVLRVLPRDALYYQLGH